MAGWVQSSGSHCHIMCSPGFEVTSQEHACQSSSKGRTHNSWDLLMRTDVLCPPLHHTCIAIILILICAMLLSTALLPAGSGLQHNWCVNHSSAKQRSNCSVCYEWERVPRDIHSSCCRAISHHCDMGWASDPNERQRSAQHSDSAGACSTKCHFCSAHTATICCCWQPGEILHI